MIQVDGLAKNYKDFPALHTTSFTIGQSHGITALLGPNGAGKTTILRLLTGYLTPTRGSIKIAGMEMNAENHVKIKQRIGYLPETTPLYPEMLLIEYLEFMGQARGLVEPILSKNAKEMVELLELGSHLYTPLSLLSKGFRQRVALAATLIHKPDYIILDEPTSGLDPNQIQHIRKLIKRLGQEQTLILSTHVLQEVEDICDRVIILSRGKVVIDESTQVLRNAQSCRIVVRGRKKETKSELKNALSNLPIIKNLKDLENRENQIFALSGNTPNDYEIFICELKEDKPEELFKQVSKIDLDVRELSPVARSLQDVFHELTV